MSEAIVDTTVPVKMETLLMYSSPKSNDKGGKSVTVLNRAFKKGLMISTPLMLTWGASDYVDPEGKSNGKYEMSLQFPQKEYIDDDCQSFLNFCKGLESKIKEDALANSKEWFGKVHRSAEIIDELFTPMLKYPRVKGTSEPDFNKSPTLRVKLPQWQGAWKTVIYDEEENQLFPDKTNPLVTPLDFLKKGATVACLLRCGGIWFTNGKFTVTWQLSEVIVKKPEVAAAGPRLKLKSSDKEKLKSVPAPANDDDDVAMEARIEDSDVEDEDDELPPAPAALKPSPAPAPTFAPAPVPVVASVFSAPAAAAVAPPSSQEEETVDVRPKKKIVRRKEN